MRAVYSFCTKFLTDANAHGGFPDAEAWWCSVALSVLLARQHIGPVALYTDAVGAAQVAQLDLPIEEVHHVFDDFAYPPQLWMALKLQTYRRQTEPFVHLDFDAYLWQPLPARLHQAPVLAQSEENDYPCYDRVLAYFLDHAGYVPDFVAAHVTTHGRQVRALNAGLYGGHDLAALHACCDAAFATMHHPANAAMFAELATHHAHPGDVFFDFNILLEQLFAAVYYQQRGVAVGYVLADHEPPYFTHLLSGAKSHPGNVRDLKQRVAHDYPTVYQRVLALSQPSS